MSKGLVWELDMENWEDIAIESYQFVIEQGKERLEEVINESHTILSWGIKILFSYIAAISGLAGYVFTTRNQENRNLLSIVVVSVVVIFSIYVVTLLFAIVSTTRRLYKGSPPSQIFYQEIFKDRTQVEAYKLLLANEIERIQDKIQRMGSINRKLIGRYRSILRISLIIVALFIFAVFKRLFSES